MQIITASETIGPQDVQVLRAGVGKLFKNGKNKIVLEIVQAGTLSSDVLRKSPSWTSWRELSGRIVLSGFDPPAKARIEGLIKPPAIPSFMDRAAALKYFRGPAPSAPTLAPAAKTDGNVAPGQAPLFKEDVRQREITQLGPLRKQIADLEKENLSLKEQLLAMVIERRLPSDAEGLKAKIAALEGEVADLLLKSKDAVKGKDGKA